MSNIIHLPGLIDIHVHFRDPGEINKEDFYTGTSAALSSGVTTIFDMPNNKKPIFSAKALDEKNQIAQKKAVGNWGLYFGTNGRNENEFKKVQDKVVGLKIYLNVTTGNLFIKSESLLEKVVYSWPKEKVIVFHAEGKSIDLAINLCRRYRNKIHITHVSTGYDLEKILSAKGEGINISCDVTPHHLFLTKDQKELSAGFYKVKPPLSSKEDVNYLWQNLDKIDCIASDHAPHTIVEKQSDNPPSGLPGVETMLSLLLTAIRHKRLTIDSLIRLTNINPQKIFGFKQTSDTYVEVDIEEKYNIDNNNLFTKCAWTPYDDWQVYGKVKKVYIKGKKAFEDKRVLVKKGFGQNILNN